MGMPKAGEAAPDFRLAGDDGKPIALADYRGKHVVLFFFVKALTSG